VRALCGGDVACPGTCDGVTAAKCTYPAKQCRVQSCSSNILVSMAVCDANGACPAVMSMACPATAPVCDSAGTQCVKLAAGKGCSADGQCSSGKCGGSFCCQAGLTCTGPCDTGGCDTGGACLHVQDRTQCGKIPGPSATPGDNDVYQICVAGACVAPKVNCGGASQSCSLSATTACCGRFADPNDGSSIQPRSCGALSTCVPWHTNSQSTGESCRVTADCPMGNKCCLYQQDASAWQACAPDCGNSAEVCDVNHPVCSTGTCQFAGDNYFHCL
jgi:hypothetical protein